MANDIKTKVLSGLFWKFGERIAAQLVTFIVSIVLARLLTPADYGVIAIVNIFITIANVFVDSGFGNSLIQKKDADPLDFSSVFYFNIASSILIYFLIYTIAPFVAKFYDMQILENVLRVLGLRLIVAGVNSVQHAYVSKHMLFRRFFWSTLFGTLLSAVVGIVMAYKGCGVWALVGQYMTNTTVDTVVLWFTVKWRPIPRFSFKRLKSLFSFGWKLLVSSLINTVYLKIRQLFIGKAYTSEDLALYNKGDHFPSFIITNVNTSIQSVLFPAMSTQQDKKENIKTMVRRSIKTSSYIMFPLMMGLALIAEPFIKLMLTDKWIECVPYLQIACVIYAFIPIHTANLQAINAMGRSDIFLRLEIIKKVIGLTVFFIAIPHGVMAIAFSGIITSFITSIINAFPNKKLLNYSYIEQIKDISPAILLSGAMGGCVYAIGLLPLSALPIMIIQIVSGGVIYVLLSLLFKTNSFIYIKETIKNILKRG